MAAQCSAIDVGMQLAVTRLRQNQRRNLMDESKGNRPNEWLRSSTHQYFTQTAPDLLAIALIEGKELSQAAVDMAKQTQLPTGGELQADTSEVLSPLLGRMF